MMKATLSYQELGMEMTILLPLRKDRGAESPPAPAVISLPGPCSISLLWSQEGWPGN